VKKNKKQSDRSRRAAHRREVKRELAEETRKPVKQSAKVKAPVKLVAAGAIEQPPKVRGIPGKKMEKHHIEAIKRSLRVGVENAITIKGLAVRMRCSMGAAERRFNRYMKLHPDFALKVKSFPVREHKGARGPMAMGFFL
jgi:hypothetical protein